MSVAAGGPAGASLLKLVHYHPGRLRVRADAFVGDTPLVVRVRDALMAREGVGHVAHNPSTGSVLLEYEPGRLDPDDLLALVVSSAGLSGVLDCTAGGAGHKDEPGARVAAVVRSLNEAAYETTEGRADLRFLVPAALASLAAVSFVANAKNSRLPRWDNLLYWSYSVYRDWHQEYLRKPPTTP